VTDEVLVIAPESQLGSGGVGDYTLRLLEHLPDPSTPLVPPLDFTRLPSSGGRVLVQYSAYGFNRYGFPRDLIRGLIEWKQQTRGRLVVMFHEIWTFWPITNKNYFVQLLHRRAIKQLLAHLDVAFTSTPTQVEHLLRLNRNAAVRLLPVGSNIRRMSDFETARVAETAVLFGLQRARIRALRQMQSSLERLASSGRITKLIVIGEGNSPEGDEEERALLSSLRWPRGFEQLGAQPEQSVSKLLLSAGFGIFGQNELSITKSGTFMAYASHGLNMLSDSGDHSKPEPFCWLVTAKELIAGISSSELAARAENLRNWQKRTSSWELIASKVAEALQLNLANRPQFEVAGR
jgi:hypothetical protein